MGISIAQYRQAIGVFNSNCTQSNNKLNCVRDLYQNTKFCEGKFDTRKPLDIFVHYILYSYILYIYIYGNVHAKHSSSIRISSSKQFTEKYREKVYLDWLMQAVCLYLRGFYIKAVTQVFF